jgi:HEAT repeat protein
MAGPFRRLVFLSLSATLLPAQTEDRYNSNQRILRIRELGKRSVAALPTLSQYLADPDRDIRIEAVKAIVKIDTERSLDALVVAMKDRDPDVQIRATDGIVNAYVPGYAARGGLPGAMTRGTRQVRSFFSSRNDQVVGVDVEIRPDAGRALADVVNGGASIEARANAARAAGIVRDQAAVPALEQGLHGKDGDLIFECLVALQKIHATSAGPSVSFLAHDLDERIQITALETIGILGSTASAPDVRSVLRAPRNIKVRRAALEALAMLGMAEDRSTFSQYSNDRDAELRASALEGLGRIRQPEDFPILEGAFDEGEIDWRIHLAAAFGMVNEGNVDTSEFSALRYLVENLQAKGRSEVASAYLKELANRKNVIEALAKMLPELEKAQKVSLCPVFAIAESSGGDTPLKVLARDIDPDVAVAASKALRTMQNRRPPS